MWCSELPCLCKCWYLYVVALVIASTLNSETESSTTNILAGLPLYRIGRGFSTGVQVDHRRGKVKR
ncbi:hypothetical protein M758_UG193800 [Ceratodon purpureus]|nr:hypothetical protein M758_UG193800 [Ceratodon purpureus]